MPIAQYNMFGFQKQTHKQANKAENYKVCQKYEKNKTKHTLKRQTSEPDSGMIQMLKLWDRDLK